MRSIVTSNLELKDGRMSNVTSNIVFKNGEGLMLSPT